MYLVDGDFRIRHVNPSTFEVFGDIPDLIGRDFDEVIHILWPQALADEVVRLFRRTLETGEPYICPELIEDRLDRGVTELAGNRYVATGMAGGNRHRLTSASPRSLHPAGSSRRKDRG